MWFLDKYNAIKAGSLDGSGEIPHDRGLVKAQNAEFIAPRKEQNEDITEDARCTLFIGKVDFGMTEDELQKLFDPFGRIVKARIVRNLITGESRGYGFIEFKRPQECMKAYTGFRLIPNRPQNMFVDMERGRIMKEWKPRRLGGGLGGKKGSGQMRFGGRERGFKYPSGQVIPTYLRNDLCWR